MSSVVGLMLNSGRTYSYFSDNKISNKTFAAGTSDLNMELTQLIEIDKSKLGDKGLPTRETT